MESNNDSDLDSKMQALISTKGIKTDSRLIDKKDNFKNETSQNSPTLKDKNRKHRLS